MIATIWLVKRHFEFLLCLVIFLVFKRYCKRKKVVKYSSGYLKSDQNRYNVLASSSVVNFLVNMKIH